MILETKIVQLSTKTGVKCKLPKTCVFSRIDAKLGPQELVVFERPNPLSKVMRGFSLDVHPALSNIDGVCTYPVP